MAPYKKTENTTIPWLFLYQVHLWYTIQSLRLVNTELHASGKRTIMTIKLTFIHLTIMITIYNNIILLLRPYPVI